MRHIELPTLKWRFLWHRIISKMICRVCCSLQYVRKMNDTLKCWALIVNWDRCNVAFFFFSQTESIFLCFGAFFRLSHFEMINKLPKNARHHWAVSCGFCHVVFFPARVFLLLFVHFLSLSLSSNYCLVIHKRAHLSLSYSTFQVSKGIPEKGKQNNRQSEYRRQQVRWKSS